MYKDDETAKNVVNALLDSPKYYTIELRLYFFYCLCYEGEVVAFSLDYSKIRRKKNTLNAQIRSLRTVAALALNIYYTINVLIKNGEIKENETNKEYED